MKKHDSCHTAVLLRMAKAIAVLDSLLNDKYQLYHSLLHGSLLNDKYQLYHSLLHGLRSGPEVIKLFFMLNSDEHEILNAHKYKNIK